MQTCTTPIILGRFFLGVFPYHHITCVFHFISPSWKLLIISSRFIPLLDFGRSCASFGFPQSSINWFYDEPEIIYTGKLLELNEEGIDFLQSGLISHNQNKNLFLLFNTIISYRIQNVKFFSHFFVNNIFLNLSLLSGIIISHGKVKVKFFSNIIYQKEGL